ncbi:MAG: hypothetical protein A2315_12040 [Ignavibacteria bacterium RIFOXYB2_FULL_35_12]|nr:MAG: hypothetical protein A2006_05170 [Ignavibacteria bacterium GWC2_35_8]OGU61781.1 MAG: hypothetical protein A2X60_00125 [Ignavibacteria bacterium GWF2_35_20]OGU78768.1 MAG: hypothetical protein A2W11_06700 [Ignavibacteria bacterium RBG_16_35_7]OGU85826.1 MAG: hypothetical protein A3K31_07860 [Ignavibacteria bacterium RIFOXYA12_FULL_35_25]OGU89585.1 MAG: hypothetical protein A2492_11150 [Ignavibacteria bacterium RIFOXYC12_FULL_35_11]OGU96517.1 MAG: hypothetical protein A2347_10680 [Ignavi
MFKKIFVAAIFLFATVFLFISCENQNTTKEVKQKEEVKPDISLREKVDSINNILDRAMLRGDYEAMLQYYTDDIIISPGLNPTVKGKAAVKESYEKNRKMEVQYHSFDGTAEDIWESGDKVYERGTFGVSLSYKDHPKPLAYYGSYFTIWQKASADSLKIKYVIWNLGFNPCD